MHNNAGEVSDWRRGGAQSAGGRWLGDGGGSNDRSLGWLWRWRQRSEEWPGAIDFFHTHDPSPNTTGRSRMTLLRINDCRLTMSVFVWCSASWLAADGLRVSSWSQVVGRGGQGRAVRDLRNPSGATWLTGGLVVGGCGRRGGRRRLPLHTTTGWNGIPSREIAAEGREVRASVGGEVQKREKALGQKTGSVE